MWPILEPEADVTGENNKENASHILERWLVLWPALQCANRVSIEPVVYPKPQALATLGE